MLKESILQPIPTESRLLADPFRLLVESIAEYGILVLDPSGTVRSCSASTERLLGRSAAAIVGQQYSTLFSADNDCCDNPMRDLELACTTGCCERDGIPVSNNGSQLTASICINALQDEHGTHTGFSLVLHDTSERIQIEEMLRHEDEVRRSIADNTTTAIIITDADNRCVFMNRSGEKLTGFTFAEMQGENVHEMIHHTRPDGSPFPASECPVGQAVTSLQELRAYEDVFVRKDGTFVPVLCQIKPLALHGKLANVVVELVDITERKQADAERASLLAAVTASANGIVITDPAGNMQWVNPAFARMTGYSLEEVVGKNPRLLNSGAQSEQFYQHFWQTISSGQVWQGKLLNRKKDGSTYMEEMTVTPVLDTRGRITNYIAVKHDITERENLEQQLVQAQKMEAIGQLAGGVAHDFNNLLTVISGFSNIVLSMLPANDPKRVHLKAILDAGERAAGLTQQLLAFSRKTVIEPKVLDMNLVVKDTEKMLRRLIGEDIVLKAALARQSLRIKVDPGQLSQVLLNLAVNARDAMPRGGSLTIATDLVEYSSDGFSQHTNVAPGKYVRLTVQDTGCGMTAEIKSRIFEPFFTTKPKGKGTGLGLATVYGIVMQNGGHIDVESLPGSGATFHILFPEVQGDPAPAFAEVGNPQQGCETILLVEDEEGVRGYGKLILETHGYTVLAADSGRCALALAEAHGDINLLLTDVVMPEMSGRELAEELHRSRPEIKVLYMSGYTDDTIVRHGVIQATDAFLHKPFSPLGLTRKIRQILDTPARPRG